MALKTCLLLLACATFAMAQSAGRNLGPTYTLQTYIRLTPNNSVDRAPYLFTGFSNRTHFEWENYDGWYNNPAHVEWGGAGK